MAAITNEEIFAGLARQRALPLFTCGDVDTAMEVLQSLHAAGIRFVEFTNRSAAALDVFRGMLSAAAARLPDMVLGAGTILDDRQARDFHEAGAAFLVAPNLDEGVGAYCVRHELFWCPGAGSVTEIVRARRLGASLVKVFPADTLGGPAFVKAVRGPCPDIPLMPSGGVTLDEANLEGWFAAGVHCVGIGSQLVDAKSLAAGDFGSLVERTRRLTAFLATL